MEHLFPPIEPFNTGHLKASDLHSVYYEQCGNKDGLPVIVLHGGPGGGISPLYRRFFNPEKYHIILADQRGAGQSTPFASLVDNTTHHLIQDIELLRQKLKIDKWVVFGGSWGSTLSLAYAEKHTDRVLALVLRGIFTLRREELIWYYQYGAHFIYPDLFEKFVEPIPEVERADLMSAYYRRLTGSNEKEKLRCARAWTEWEVQTSRLLPDPEALKKADDKFCLAFARIECHYFVNGGFFEENDQLIKRAGILEEAKIPCVIAQGRYDVVCPTRTAWDLSKAYPSAQLYIVADAGHSVREEGITKVLVEATERFAEQLM